MALVSPVFTKINKNTKFPNHLAREPVTIECYKINHRQIFSIKAKPGITKQFILLKNSEMNSTVKQFPFLFDFQQKPKTVNYNIQAGAVANYLWGPICFPCLYLWSLENFRQIKSWHEITPGEDKLRLAWVGWTRGRRRPGIVSSDKCDSDELRRMNIFWSTCFKFYFIGFTRPPLKPNWDILNWDI